MTLRLLLNPERCARLVRQKMLDPSAMSLDELLERLQAQLVGPTYKSTLGTAYHQEIGRMLERKFVEQLIGLATDREADGAVRAAAHGALMRIQHTYAGSLSVNKANTYNFAARLIRQYESNPDQPMSTTPLTAPEGAPIDPGQEWLEPDCDWR